MHSTFISVEMRNMFARDEEVNGVMRDVDVYLRELIYIYISRAGFLS